MLLVRVDDQAVRTEIGKRIRQSRGAARLTQEAVADELHLDKSQVSRWERGRGAPSVMQLMQLALKCDVRPETLIEGIVEPTFEQLTHGLDREARAALYTVAEVLTRRPSADVQAAAPRPTSATGSEIRTGAQEEAVKR